MYLYIAVLSALWLMSASPNDDNLDRLLDRFYATANHQSLLNFLSCLPVKNLIYLTSWLNNVISVRNLSEFGYWILA